MKRLFRSWDYNFHSLPYNEKNLYNVFATHKVCPMITNQIRVSVLYFLTSGKRRWAQKSSLAYESIFPLALRQ